MSEIFFDRLIGRCAKERFLFVLVSIICFLIVSPLLKGFIGLSSLLDIFLSIILVSSIYAVSQKRLDWIIATLLVLPLLFSTWTSHFIKSPTLSLVHTCSGILFFAFMAIAILSFVLKENKVTLNVIYASIVAYLFIALTWSFIFILVEKLQPGSFALAQSQLEERSFYFYYYSFVTITTLGYGDITPTSDISRSLAVVEAVIGQIYLVVLVARLVGLQISQSMKE